MAEKTASIKTPPIKDSWSREELLLNMQYYMEYCQQKGYVTPKQWIEEHKHF